MGEPGPIHIGRKGPQWGGWWERPKLQVTSQSYGSLPRSMSQPGASCGEGVHITSSSLAALWDLKALSSYHVSLQYSLFPCGDRLGQWDRRSLTKAALNFPSDMGSSGAILGKVGQLSPAPWTSITSLSSVAIQKTMLPIGA